MKPVIGITCSANQTSQYLADDYIKAVRMAGGVPVLLPAGGEEDIPLLLSKTDGILLSGGGDVDPSWFGEEPVPGLGEIEPGRDAFEIALCRFVHSGGYAAFCHLQGHPDSRCCIRRGYVPGYL